MHAHGWELAAQLLTAAILLPAVFAWTVRMQHKDKNK